MALDEVLISRAIIERNTQKLLDYPDLEVAVVGGGVSGLTAAAQMHEQLSSS
jgi:sulfide-dependent adenosine diphosphate thiazole synthase